MAFLLYTHCIKHKNLSKEIQGIKSVLLLALLLFASPLSANMEKNLESAFKALGMPNNVTKAGGYLDQTGGFYTGGSIFARSKANNAELFSLQMPHYRAGCGGIDLFLGGFSFISVDEFTELLRSIGSNASGYAFHLALATVTPQIKSVLDGLLDTVRDMTNQSINSCEAGATLLAGAWPQSDASTQVLCQAIGSSFGKASDWVSNRQKCGAKGERDKINAEKDKVPGFQDILGDEFNLTWKALKKNAFLTSDDDLAAFFMTLSGTIISKKIKGEKEKQYTHVRHYPSKTSDQDLITALIEGNAEAKVYKCDVDKENKCLNPSLISVTLGKKALSQKVGALLGSIQTKLWNDTEELTPEERAFINSTLIPILKIMAVEMAFKKGGPPISVLSYQAAIAHDILLQYLDEVMELVWTSLTQLKEVQISDEMIEKFRVDITASRQRLFAERTKMFEQISLTLEAIERTHQIEMKLQNAFIAESIQREQ